MTAKKNGIENAPLMIVQIIVSSSICFVSFYFFASKNKTGLKIIDTPINFITVSKFLTNLIKF